MSKLGFKQFVHRISAGGVDTVTRLLDLGPDGILGLAGGLEVSAIQAGFDRNVALEIWNAEGQVVLAAAGDIDGVANNKVLNIAAVAMLAGEKVWRISEGFGGMTLPPQFLMFGRWAVMKIIVSGGASGTADINAFLRTYGAAGQNIKDIT